MLPFFKGVFVSCELVSCELYCLEFYFRGCFCSFCSFEIGLFFKTIKSCENLLREFPDICIVFPCRFIELPSFVGNPVFCSFKLGLKIQEVLVCFQSQDSVPPQPLNFDNAEERASCACWNCCKEAAFKFAASIFTDVALDLASITCSKSFLLMSSISLNGVHKIWDEVGTPLVYILNLRPFFIDLLFHSYHFIVDIDGIH